jgi:hypothetical protein
MILRWCQLRLLLLVSLSLLLLLLLLLFHIIPAIMANQGGIRIKNNTFLPTGRIASVTLTVDNKCDRTSDVCKV